MSGGTAEERVEAQRDRFAPIFARIAEEASRRDHDSALALELVDQLKSAGFGAILVPEEDGGPGVGYLGLVSLLIELAAADPNVAQVFRSHFHVVEVLVAEPESDFRRRWLQEVRDGRLFSNGVTNTPETPLGGSSARIGAENGRPVLHGAKSYTTGSLFADWLLVIADRADGEQGTVFVSASAPGVSLVDDWDGFGQRTTSTGSARFTAVPLEPWQFVPVRDPSRFGDILQLILLAVAAGIARNAARDLADQVRRRTRVYLHGSSGRTRQDPQLLDIVGEVAAAADTAAVLVRDLGGRHEGLHRLRAAGASAAEIEALHLRTVAAVYSAQTVLLPVVLNATTRLFDALGASATRRELALDRHWRNARAIASHNPRVFRSRIYGSWLVNGELDTVWGVGEHRAEPSPLPA